MSASKKVFEFDDAQRRELAALGVVPSQLEALEDVMPRFATMLRPSPGLNDLRDTLGDLEKALSGAARQLRRFDLFVDDNVAGVDARDRVVGASIARLGADRLLTTQLAVEELLECVQSVQADIPTGQKHDERAKWGPVQLIDEALTRGWGDVEGYPHTPTSTQGTRFAGIVVICYDVVLRSNGQERKRAIDSYVSWLNAHRSGTIDSPPENLT